MATTFSIHLPADTPGAQRSACAAFDEIDRVERLLTVYDEQSPLSLVNRQASIAPVVVDDELFALLFRAFDIGRSTREAFDITAGPLIKSWGFYARNPRVPDEETLVRARRRSGLDGLILDPIRKSVRFAHAGMEINLGSIGKGYALDRAAAVLTRLGISTALLDGGKSSVYALTARGQAPWPVGIRHPWEDYNIAVLKLRGRALATSAASFQHLVHQGRRLGHLIDPRTGWPASGMASVSVLASTAAEADALATAFFILGEAGASDYCAAHPETAAIMLPENGSPFALNLRPSELHWCRV
jgi:thiamine biosynthesis lipoprotein